MSKNPADCYWRHSTTEAQRYPCLDRHNEVCARCCVERCVIDTPDWFASCATAGHPTWPSVARGRLVPSKLVCLESYWDERLFETVSVRGFLEALRPTVRPPLRVAHRFFESRGGLAYYTKRPNGLLWKQDEVWDAPIYYLALHGAPGSVFSILDSIGSETLCDSFRGYDGYDCLVYFGCCSVLRGKVGERFARDFLEASGCRAVIGYSADIDWMPSMLADLLFFQRFYSHSDPWNALSTICASIQHDFRPARDFGLSLVLEGT